MRKIISTLILSAASIGFAPLIDGQKRLHGGESYSFTVGTDARRCTRLEKRSCSCSSGKQVTGCTVKTIEGTMTQTCVCGYYNDYASR